MGYLESRAYILVKESHGSKFIDEKKTWEDRILMINLEKDLVNKIEEYYRHKTSPELAKIDMLLQLKNPCEEVENIIEDLGPEFGLIVAVSGKNFNRLFVLNELNDCKNNTTFSGYIPDAPEEFYKSFAAVIYTFINSFDIIHSPADFKTINEEIKFHLKYRFNITDLEEKLNEKDATEMLTELLVMHRRENNYRGYRLKRIFWYQSKTRPIFIGDYNLSEIPSSFDNGISRSDEKIIWTGKFEWIENIMTHLNNTKSNPLIYYCTEEDCSISVKIGEKYPRVHVKLSEEKYMRVVVLEEALMKKVLDFYEYWTDGKAPKTDAIIHMGSKDFQALKRLLSGNFVAVVTFDPNPHLYVVLKIDEKLEKFSAYIPQSTEDFEESYIAVLQDFFLFLDTISPSVEEEKTNDAIERYLNEKCQTGLLEQRLVEKPARIILEQLDDIYKAEKNRYKALRMLQIFDENIKVNNFSFKIANI